MDGKTYDVWNRLKSTANNGTGIYTCTDADDKRHINELINAGYITGGGKLLGMPFFIYLRKQISV